jgi:hypothetical protein
MPSMRETRYKLPCKQLREGKADQLAGYCAVMAFGRKSSQGRCNQEKSCPLLAGAGRAKKTPGHRVQFPAGVIGRTPIDLVRTRGGSA